MTKSSTLHSKGRDITVEQISLIGGYQEITLPVTTKSFTELTPSVRDKPSLSWRLRPELERDGLLWPLVIIENSAEHWRHPAFQCVAPEFLLPYDPDADFVVVVGNNRYYAAKPNYLAIDCIVIPSLNWLYPVQLKLDMLLKPLTDEQRKQYQQ